MGSGPEVAPHPTLLEYGDTEVVLIVNHQVTGLTPPCLSNPQAQLVAKPVTSGRGSAEA